MGSSGQNWRVEIDAYDYMLHERKQTTVDNRRPVIRRASDLVGPGIGATAVRVTDLGDLLAQFNGYFSCLAGATGAPNADEDFVGMTITDGELGGTQIFTGLDSRFEYQRVFTRNPTDPSSILWGPWGGTERVPATATSGAPETVVAPPGSLPPFYLTAPAISTIGLSGTYDVVGGTLLVLRQGVYTGFVNFESVDSIPFTLAHVEFPQGDSIKTVVLPVGITGASVPLNFWTSGIAQSIRVRIAHDEGTSESLIWRDYSLTRVGDAL